VTAQGTTNQEFIDQVAGRLFGERLESEKRTLTHLNDINLAHVIMLRETEIIEAGVADALLVKLLEIDARGIDALGDLSGNEGLYLAYEGSLIDELGIEVGGALHTARSRNDLGATIHRMHTRVQVMLLLDAVLGLRESLIHKARSHVATVMTGYTHFQPAQPVTLAHWLLAIEAALSRDTARLIAALDRTDALPLGSCALAGTDFPIDPSRTADLLGFGEILDNSLDAVAGRDYATETLAACAILATTLSRAATDLHVWYTHEFGYFTLPPALSGGSSIMPQKKNPVALEILKGRSAQAMSAFETTLMAQKNTSYSNVVDVNRESLRGFDSALEVTVDLVDLMHAVVDGMNVDKERMASQAAVNFSTVTLLTNFLVRERDYSFRAAYQLVKQVVETATQSGYASTDLTPQMLDDAAGRPLEIPDETVREMLDPERNINSLKYGSGPAPSWCSDILDRRAEDLKRDEAAIDAIAGAVHSNRRRLLEQAREIVSR
jgi:argininosuccinate lyase